MKILENTTVYCCDFCKKKLYRKHAMIKHEEHCSMNPKNISACSGCIFLKEGETVFNYGYGDFETYKTSKTFHCEKLNKDLYPYKVVKKGLLEKYPETFGDMEQMPNKCEHWDFTDRF